MQSHALAFAEPLEKKRQPPLPYIYSADVRVEAIEPLEPEELLKQAVQQQLDRISAVREAGRVMHEDHRDVLTSAVRQTFAAIPEHQLSMDGSASLDDATLTSEPMNAPSTRLERVAQVVVPLLVAGVIVGLSLLTHV